jgi:predicted transposase YbfD/YdcC
MTRAEDRLEPTTIIDYFSRVADPRKARTRAHPLENVLVIALLAVLCGADSFVAMELFGKSKAEFLRTFLDLSAGIPSHDTFGRVFAALQPEALGEAFRMWTASLVASTHGEVIAIDGKTLRRSFRDATDKAFVHMVSAWATSNEVVLGQLKTDDKSNEITAIPRLLELLNIKGATVTIDAMGCQRDIARKIVDGEADYVLAVKENQPTLHGEIVESFRGVESKPRKQGSGGYFETTDHAHGRQELRRCWTTSDLQGISRKEQWASLGTLILIESTRTVGEETTVERHYHISSKRGLAAREALATCRAHWGIENKLHWVLDVAYREDDCRVRAGCAAENFTLLRHITLNLLKRTTSQGGIKNRRLRAGWDHDYLLRSVCGGSQ